MPYESIDQLQNLLATHIFKDRPDTKKAAGRALGTFIEIITFYLLKIWGFENHIFIERRLPEFQNNKISHNVEFTLHGFKSLLKHLNYSNEDKLTSNFFRQKLPQNFDSAKYIWKTNKLCDKNNIKNACTIAESDHSILNAYFDSINNRYTLNKLRKKPFAMFECKRVGKEEGVNKGPQTIEKAKQGAYVANTVSNLQKFRGNDGIMMGIFYDNTKQQYINRQYTDLLNEIIDSDDINILEDFILTVGIVSNHGNWFTSDNPGKELQILANAYDLLFFLTDNGMAQFIMDLLIEPRNEYQIVKKVFEDSYSKLTNTPNCFTKVTMNIEADRALIHYFNENLTLIESWFNPITKNTSIELLKQKLKILSLKNWRI